MLPPVRLTVPPETVMLPSVRFETRFPLVTLARPVTFPPEIFDVPLVTLRLASVPPVTFRVAADVVAATVPPVILAIPAPTVRVPSVALAVKVPPVTFERPVTLAEPPFRLVMLLEAIEANVPPVAFKLPALVVAPIVPPEILAVPAAPTFRLVRLAALIKVPPVTLADAPEPAVIFVVPAFTVTEPAETVTFPRLMAVIKVPADETLPVVTNPPVRLAVPEAPTVRLSKLTLEISVPAVTFAVPLNVPLERLDVPPFTISPLSVPPV